MFTKIFQTLRARLIFLVLLAAVPALIVTISTGNQQRLLARQQAENDTMRLAHSIGTYQAARVEGARHLLRSLSRSDRLLGTPAACEAELNLLKGIYPTYAAFSLFDLKGEVVCSSAPSHTLISIADRHYFQQVIAGEPFAAGGAVIGRISNRSVVPVAHQVLGEDGSLAAVFAAEMDLEQTLLYAENLNLLPGSAALIVDADGTILNRYPAESVGETLPEVPIIDAMLSAGLEGRTVARGVDGVQRLYGFTQLMPDSSERVYAAVGVPTALVYENSDQIFRNSLVWVVIATLLAISAAWFGGEIFFLRVVSLTAERDAAEAQLRQINQALEQRVNERTAELEEAATRLSFELIERRKAEELAVQRAEEAEEGRRVLEALMEFTPEGIAVADGDESGGMRIVSRYGQEDAGWVVGQPDGETGESARWQMLSAEDGQAVEAERLPLNRALATGEVITDEEWVLCGPDGKLRYLSINAGPIRSADGSIAGGVITWRDITERKHATQALEEYAIKLERSNTDLQDFAYIASHDLQEPLRKIQAFGERLMARFGDALGSEGHDFAERMVSSAARMQMMVNDLLDYSRVNSRTTGFERVDLNELMTDVLGDLEQRLTDTQGQVVVGDLPAVVAERTQVRQLMMNLISNSLKFHRQGIPPVVKVSAELVRSGWRSENQGVKLTVEDNGIGFDEKYAERIFQPFQRLHERDKYPGSGIGLSICRKIVERHGGTISAHSIIGEGTRFVITLPLVPRQP